MKNFKRITALLVAAMMIFSMVGCGNKKNTNPTPVPTGDETEATTEAATTEAQATTEPVDVPTELTINLHYLREDGNYEGWNAWLWPDGGNGNAYAFGDADDKGAVTTATFPAGTSKIGYIIRLNEWEAKDVESDQFMELAGIIAGTVDVYVKSKASGCEIVKGADCVSGISVVKAAMDGDYKTLNVEFTEEYTDSHTLKVLTGSDEIEIDSIENNGVKSKVTLKAAIDPMSKYSVELDGIAFDITIPDYFSTDSFEKEYTYDGDDLGATWSKDSTTFKVWAPTAKAVSVKTYKSGTKGTDDLIEAYEMTAEDKGVWSVKVDGDLNKVYYTYEVDLGDKKNEACDPYAKAVGVNGERAMVIDLASTNPDGWDKDVNPHKGMDATDATVYEIHVRDLSSDASSGITNVGKFLGFTENGTKNAAGQSTGIDHILDLGVTHVQILPMYDYATVDETKLDKAQFNWGYDPKNYNAPEGSYSTDPYNGEVRVSEAKQMIKSLHDNGLSVVMDVVYNHTYSTDFCFNKIVPDFFYRPGSNGSGCGNDVASERAMVSKFIVDSVVYWAKEYHIDGFRFDLVGLLDVDTMQAIRDELDKIDPSIILYGEGWDMSTKTTKSTTLAKQFNINKITNFGMFNDTIRDALKGSVFTATDKGYVNGNTSKTKTIMMNITGETDWSDLPYQQINYTSCHDNLSLWDKINSSNASDSLEDRIKQNLLCAAVVYTSQGIPFIQAGEEILRTKPKGSGFDSNSYASSDATNSIKWDTLGDANTQMVYEYYKGLIAFRKAHASMTLMETAKKYYTFSKDLDAGVIAYELTGVKDEVADSIFVVHNAGTSATTVTLPDGEWKICVQGTTAGTNSLGTATGSITVDPISTTVLVKGALK